MLALERGSSVYMNGTGDYHVREQGKPGILLTLTLFPEDYEKLIYVGAFVEGR